MIKYQSEDHYKFHSVKLPCNQLGKIILYFKRIPHGEDLSIEDSIYTNMNNFVSFPKENTTEKNTSAKMDRGDIPKSRTLVIMNFDKAFEIKPTMKVFKLCGEIRRVYCGQTKMTDESNRKKTIYIGLVVFKNEHCLTKAFDVEFFQNRINQKYGKPNKEINNYAEKILTQYENGDQAKDQMVKEAREDGFNIVTNKSGDFTIDLQNPKYKKQNWVGRNKNKTKKEIDAEEVHAVIDGADAALPKKQKQDMENKQKRALLEQFKQDKEKLKKVKLNQ